ncbi:MAG: GAF domain-containing sensor histidine kinase [Microcoleaceae cyanobacterium]
MLNNPLFQPTLDVRHLCQQIQHLQQENAQLKAQLGEEKPLTLNPLLQSVSCFDCVDLFRTIADMMPMPMSVSRVADSKILYANTQFVSMFGLSAWAIQNYTMSEFCTDAAQYQMLLEQVFQPGEIYRQPLKVQCKEGSTLSTVVSVQCLSVNQQQAILTVFDEIDKHPSETSSNTASTTLRDRPLQQSIEPTNTQPDQSQPRYSQAMRDLCHYNTIHSRDLKLVVRKITETAAQTLQVERVSVWLHPILQQSLLDPEGFTQWLETAPISASPWSNILNLKFVCLDYYQQAEDCHWIDGRQPIVSSRPFQEAILTQHLIHTRLNDADIDPGTDETAIAHSNESEAMQSLQIPIRLAEETIGMLWIATDDSHRCWTVEEQTFAEFLANFVALSLEQFERQLTETALSQVKQQLEHQVETRTTELKQAVIQLRQEMIERIKTESALQQALDAAQVANRAQSTFITTMSHEFRTPLHIILGYADMLYEEASDQHLTDFIPDVQHIRQAGIQLLHLIDNILDLAKLEAGQMVLHPETCDLASMVNEMLTQMSSKAKENQNQLTVNYQTPTALIYTDVNKLRHILMNLLDNALKFTHQGEVYLVIYQTQRQNQDWICFQVKDTGIGIDPEQQQHLFQPFTQVDPSINRSYNGLGLGLTLTHQFCRMMGGEITVRSQLGLGSTFTVCFPLVACPQ